MNIFSIVQGWLKIRGGTDSTFIGNDGDRIKTKPILDQANRSAFGDNMCESMQPITQFSAVYGLNGDTETFEATGGTADTADGMFQCNITNAIGSYSVIRSEKSVVYREGQGLMCRFTSIFDSNAVANSLQIAGFFNLTDTVCFGYRGADFGIIFDTFGEPEIRDLTITSAGNGTLTLTLDGTAYNIPVTSGSIQHNVYEIETWLNANQTVWTAQQDGDRVIFQARDTSARTGTYSVSGAGSFAGTFSQLEAGAAKNETEVLRANWDYDPPWFDPDTPNVYMIKVSYLGFGPIKFFIMNNTTGEYELVHTLKFIGTATKPSLSKRALKVGWACASLGSTTALSLKGASAGVFIEGDSKVFGEGHSISGTNSSVGNTYVSVVSVRTKVVFKNKVMLGRLVPLRVTIANDAGKPVEFIIVKNANFGETDFSSHLDDSIAQENFSQNTIIAPYDEIEGGVLSAGGSATINLDDLDLDLQLNDTLTVFARKTSGTNPSVTARITWKEDF